MPLGYCPVCKELRTIRKGPPTLPGERESWHMAEHEAPDGTRCSGKGRKV